MSNAMSNNDVPGNAELEEAARKIQPQGTTKAEPETDKKAAAPSPKKEDKKSE